MSLLQDVILSRLFRALALLSLLEWVLLLRSCFPAGLSLCPAFMSVKAGTMHACTQSETQALLSNRLAGGGQAGEPVTLKRKACSGP